MVLSSWFSLSGEVAVVTGASRGLGRGFAEALAQAGAFVVCTARSREGLDETVSRIVSCGGRAVARQADFAKPQEIKETIDGIVEQHGKIDILVNNAGTEIPKSFLEVSEEDYDTIMGINLKGLYFAAQAAARRMVEQRKGKIINIGSLGSQIGLAGASVYCASKGGVLQLTRALAVELAPHHVQVNALGPGYYRTAMTEPFFQDPGHKSWIEERIPMGRIGAPADLQAALVFLAGRGSDYITGQILYVDGGWLAS